MVLVLHCFSLCDHCSLFFGFCVFFFLLSLGVALHFIHAFHSRCIFFILYIYIYIYKGKEKEAHCVLALSSLFLKTRLVNLFSHDMSLVLCLASMGLFIALD